MHTPADGLQLQRLYIARTVVHSAAQGGDDTFFTNKVGAAFVPVAQLCNEIAHIPRYPYVKLAITRVWENSTRGYNPYFIS
jgi:hypothetical protein